MFDLKQLRSFQAVAEHRSFSAAAKELGYTQPAISQHIASLEAELATKLVHRLPRSIRLTGAGEALVEHANAINDRIAEARSEIEAIANLEGGMVRLASIPTAGASLVPVAVAAFRDAHPAIDVRLSIACELEGATIIEAGQADIAMLVESDLEPDCAGRGIERTHLFDDPFYLVMPRDHPKAGEDVADLADFSAEKWIQDESPCPDGMIARRACEQAGFEPDVMFQSDDYSAIQGYISAGAGLALIPGIALQSLRSDLVAKPLKGSPAMRYMVAIAPSPEHRSVATDALLATLVEVAAEFRGRLPAEQLIEA